MGCGRLYFTRGGLLPTSYGGVCSWLTGWLMWEGLSCCSEGLVMFMLLYQQKCDRGLFSCNDDVTYRSVCPSVEETLMCGGHSDVAISARYCVLCSCSAVSVPVPYICFHSVLC